MIANAPCCARCKKECPTREPGQTGPRAGLLFPIRELPKELLNHPEVASLAGPHLCGECWFDFVEHIPPAHL